MGTERHEPSAVVNHRFTEDGEEYVIFTVYLDDGKGQLVSKCCKEPLSTFRKVD